MIIVIIRLALFSTELQSGTNTTILQVEHSKAIYILVIQTQMECWHVLYLNVWYMVFNIFYFSICFIRFQMTGCVSCALNYN